MITLHQSSLQFTFGLHFCPMMHFCLCKQVSVSVKLTEEMSVVKATMWRTRMWNWLMRIKSFTSTRRNRQLTQVLTSITHTFNYLNEDMHACTSVVLCEANISLLQIKTCFIFSSAAQNLHDGRTETRKAAILREDGRVQGFWKQVFFFFALSSHTLKTVW